MAIKAIRRFISSNRASTATVGVLKDNRGVDFSITDCNGGVRFFIDTTHGRETMMDITNGLRLAKEKVKAGDYKYHYYVSVAGKYPLRLVDFAMNDADVYVLSIGIKGRLVTLHGCGRDDMISKIDTILEVAQEGMSWV